MTTPTGASISLPVKPGACSPRTRSGSRRGRKHPDHHRCELRRRVSTYTRNWQLRVVQDIAPWASFGLSVENPAALVYSSTGALRTAAMPAAGSSISPIAGNALPGQRLSSAGTANVFTADVAPDIIGKAAFDPGWGHYEVFGIARFFNDNVFDCPVVAVGATGLCRLRRPVMCGDHCPPRLRQAKGRPLAKASAVRCCCRSFRSTSTSRPRPCTAAALAATARPSCPTCMSGRTARFKRSRPFMALLVPSLTPGRVSTSTLRRHREGTVGRLRQPCRHWRCFRLRRPEPDQRRLLHHDRRFVHRHYHQLHRRQQVSLGGHHRLLAGRLQGPDGSGRHGPSVGVDPSRKLRGLRRCSRFRCWPRSRRSWCGPCGRQYGLSLGALVSVLILQQHA